MPKPSGSNTGTESTIICQCASRIEQTRDILSSYQRLPIFEFTDQQALSQLQRCRALLDALEQPDAHQNLQTILKELRDLAIDVNSDDL